MPAPGFRLPGYEVNAMLNLAPVAGALDGMREADTQRAQFGIQQSREDREKARWDEDVKQRARSQSGNLALLALKDNDPLRSANRWQQFIKSHPDAQNLDVSYHDPEIGPLRLLAEAGMSQQYLDWKIKQAAEARASAAGIRAQEMHEPQLSLARSQAASAERDLAAPKVGTADLGPDHARVFYEPRTGAEIGRIAGPSRGQAQQKFEDAAATSQAKRYDDIVSQGASQNSAMGTINSLRQLSESIGAPGVGNTVARKFGPLARSIGVEIGNLSDMEAFEALVSRLVPAQRPPGSGTMSDKDVDLFKSSLPQLVSTAAGRKFIIDQMEAIARYDIQRSQIAARALNGEVTRQQAEAQLMQLPDPMELFRRTTGKAAPQNSNAPLAPGNYVYDPATGQIRPSNNNRDIPPVPRSQ